MYTITLALIVANMITCGTVNTIQKLQSLSIRVVYKILQRRNMMLRIRSRLPLNLFEAPNTSVQVAI